MTNQNINKLKLSAEELKEYEQLQTRIKELEHKSQKLSRAELKERFAKIMKFGPERPKGMRVRKWNDLRAKYASEHAVPMRVRGAYGRWHYSRKFRVTIKRKKTIEVHPITYTFEVESDQKEKEKFSSPHAALDYARTFSAEQEGRGISVYVTPFMDGHEFDGDYRIKEAEKLSLYYFTHGHNRNLYQEWLKGNLTY